jgi:hypothetical protein
MHRPHHHDTPLLCFNLATLCGVACSIHHTLVAAFIPSHLDKSPGNATRLDARPREVRLHAIYEPQKYSIHNHQSILPTDSARGFHQGLTSTVLSRFA